MNFKAWKFQVLTGFYSAPVIKDFIIYSTDVYNMPWARYYTGFPIAI